MLLLQEPPQLLSRVPLLLEALLLGYVKNKYTVIKHYLFYFILTLVVRRKSSMSQKKATVRRMRIVGRE